MALKEINHPLVKHKIGLLRQADLDVTRFRALTKELASMLTYEATWDLPLEWDTCEGWAGQVKIQKISGKKLAVVPILRAGLGMLDGVTRSIPGIRVSFLGLYRDEATLKPVTYFKKFSGDISQRMALIIDPMLATGGSMLEAIEILKAVGCYSIRALVLVASPEGVSLVESKHPDVTIFAAALDEKLNNSGYILPGLGDAGDRLFGTR